MDKKEEVLGGDDCEVERIRRRKEEKEREYR